MKTPAESGGRTEPPKAVGKKKSELPAGPGTWVTRSDTAIRGGRIKFLGGPFQVHGAGVLGRFCLLGGGRKKDTAMVGGNLQRGLKYSKGGKEITGEAVN